MIKDIERAFFIAVGSELINSKVNSYSPVIAAKLRPFGIELCGEITCQDNKKDFKDCLSYASNKAKLIIVSGGLGPTFDDITRQAFCEFSQKKLYHSKKIEAFLRIKLSLTSLSEPIKNQCLAVKDAFLMENHNGTAFAFLSVFKNKYYLFLPGPQREWDPIWEKYSRELFKHNKKTSLYFENFKIYNIKETDLEAKIKPIINAEKNASFTILAGPAICDFSFWSPEKNTFLSIKKKTKKILGSKLIGSGNLKIQEKLKTILLKNNKTLSIAESCTGGLLSSSITDIPGSSSYYLGGINSYSNAAKIKFLKVKKSTLKKYGAVSKECAQEMSLGALNAFKSDFSVSITGIAGPSGGTALKPVGLVYFALSNKNKTEIYEKKFPGNRLFIKQSAVNFALFKLIKFVESSLSSLNNGGSL